MTTGRIDPRYGDPAATAPPWEDIERLLADAQLYWIITVRADGRPHAVPLVGVWHEGAFCFCTGPEEQKQRNLDTNPQVAVTTGSTGTHGWDSGKDVVLEGTAVRVTEAAHARGARAAPGSTSTATTGGSRSAGTASSSSVTRAAAARGAGVYRVEAAKVIAFGDSHGQTTYRF